MKINNFCMAYTRSNGCKKLSVKKCIGESCSFAQSKEQAKASLEKCFERLASLDLDFQKYISDKYYGGKMPWLKGGAEL